MASHVIDMIMMKNNFGTEAMRGVWSEDYRLQKHLDVEAALALAERVSPALNNTVNHRKEELYHD